MKTKVFLAIASWFGAFQCIRPMFYEEADYSLWWLALTLIVLGFGFFVNRNIDL